MLVSLSGILAILSLQQPAPPLTIAYEFRADSPATHFGDVTLRVSGALPESTLIQLPAWYPGRYAIYNFAANVQEVRARCGGTVVAAPKVDKQTWVVRCATALEFGFRVWWNDLSGSHSQIDSLHVDVNPGNVFPYVVGHKADPVTVTYAGPAGWSVVNGASPAPRPGALTQSFPNYDVFIDHPTEISARFTVDTFVVGPVRYRVMVHAEGPDRADLAARAALVAGVRRIVVAETAMWGDLPTPGYTFLFHFLPGLARGDGMEHLTSTQLIETHPLGRWADDAETIAHEFFHAWSMKRLRAQELGPWDYTRENHTTSLWIGEGFTNYYGARLTYRAGFYDAASYVARVGGAIAQLQETPGRTMMSARESSWNAWFFDRVRLYQSTNLGNTTISYYNKGELLGWLLDLEVRARSGGAKTLDDVMRLMWTRFWNGATTSYYLQGHGYRDDDLRQALNDVTNSDFADFFRRYVEGVEELPYGATLAKVGLELVNERGVYRIQPDPAAPAATRALGAAWLEGK
jgi:predicted metalloprotease with PDZ domain